MNNEVPKVSNILKLFRSEKGETVKFIRASTLAHYYYCSVQAYLIALGTESPPNDALAIGKRVHDDITAARQPSQLERELEEYLKGCMVQLDTGDGGTGIRGAEGVFIREFKDGTRIGHVTTHGVDDFKVHPDKSVTITEYKTTNQRYIDNYKLSTALFQVKLYAWILEPSLKAGGYNIKKMEVVYLSRAGECIGQKEVFNYESLSNNPEVVQILQKLNGNDFGRFTYSPQQVEADIAKILDQFNNPDTLIPPSRHKCFNCSSVFKNKCPFKGQQGQGRER